GLVATAVTSGPEALERVKRGEQFDAVILDYRMPGMDGLEVARELRKHSPPAALPLVMLSSIGRPVEPLGAAAIDAFMTKPVRRATLHGVLKSIFESRGGPARDAPPGAFDSSRASRLPLRILVAEGNVVNQKIASAMLSKFGYAADSVTNGAE